MSGNVIDKKDDSCKAAKSFLACTWSVQPHLVSLCHFYSDVNVENNLNPISSFSLDLPQVKHAPAILFNPSINPLVKPIKLFYLTAEIHISINSFTTFSSSLLWERGNEG
jgi:hypothetical protein